MISFREHLTESFNSRPAQITWKWQYDEEWTGTFKIDDRMYGIYLTEYEGTLDVEFSLRDGNKIRWDATGTGNAPMVFSTVVAGISAFLNKSMQQGYDIDTIRFEGSKADRSRVSLYKRMALRFGKQYGYHTLRTQDQDDSVLFILSE
ncbi:hypothetical protein VPHD479_0091 [Vibrio phage D479]